MRGNLSQLSDQLSEKLKETSDKLVETSNNLTKTLANQILQRVREFKATFSAWPEPPKKVYHRQPSRSSAVTRKPKTIAPKKKSSKSPGRKTRKK